MQVKQRFYNISPGIKNMYTYWCEKYKINATQCTAVKHIKPQESSTRLTEFGGILPFHLRVYSCATGFCYALV